jgi:hypothetical protein
MPLGMKFQLNSYISRLGGPVIGFYCLDIFPITAKATYDVIQFFYKAIQIKSLTFYLGIFITFITFLAISGHIS